MFHRQLVLQFWKRLVQNMDLRFVSKKLKDDPRRSSSHRCGYRWRKEASVEL
jgi:hypothetical protein